MSEPSDRSVCLTSPSIELLDWGYARNRRAVLMTTSAEWSQSVYSCQFESHGKRLIAPNRDYPYEGLLAHQDGENWKLIDCIGLGLRDGDGGYLAIRPEPDAPAVTLDPWRVTYAYRARVATAGDVQDLPLRVTYYLAAPTGPEASLGCVSIYIPGGPRSGRSLTLVLQPFLDIRHMYSGSDDAGYRLHTDERGFLAVTGRNRSIVFHLPEGTVNVFGSPERLDWRYKLGTGSRREVLCETNGRMETRFVPEQRQVAALFNLEAPVTGRRLLLRLPFQCGLSPEPLDNINGIRARLRRSRRSDREQLRTIESAFPLPAGLPFRGAILARIVGLTKFGTYVHRPGGGHAEVPSAGAWWFKTPWYRDVFEGILNNLDTLMRLPGERARVREVIDVALSCYNESSGLIQARLPELQGDLPPFNSSDATLLCLLAAHSYATKSGDAAFGRRAIDQTLKTLACFRNNASVDALPADGPPRLDPATGLLLCVPHHSWIDTRSLVVEYAGWKIENISNRASAAFVKDLYDRLGEKTAVEAAFEGAVFFLPEINAQWIAVLSGLLGTFDLVSPGEASPERQEVEALLERARASFKPVFWDAGRGFLFNLVHESREVRDSIECETAVTSAALLGETVFSREELRSIWRHAERTLLVHRTPQVYCDERDGGRLPFGLLTQNEDQRVYYDDDQYHADVVWPRSTPYLIRLLERLGETGVIRGLLVNNLDHQMSEGALFYNQELFSRPCGNNPTPDERTRRNPVPVKNPIQFWSQWCDPYIRFFSEGNGHG
jgi:hypothetical protein